MRRTLTALAIGLLALYGALAGVVLRADAATEFCPAEVVGEAAKASDPQSAVWSYHLRALGPRVVEGTLIAYTDGGWFTWKQQPVELTRTSYTMIARDFTANYVVATSPRLSVGFPQPVRVRYVWVETATTHGDQAFHWDARGTVTCDPADFADLNAPSPNLTQRTPDAGDPTPAPAPVTAAATATVAPFAPPTCDEPFLVATVTKAEAPEYPRSLEKDGPDEEKISVVYVAVNARGQLADAWLFKSSGYPAMDQEALVAAKRSQYAAPVSFCRPVGGTYLFRADFDPN